MHLKFIHYFFFSLFFFNFYIIIIISSSISFFLLLLLCKTCFAHSPALYLTLFANDLPLRFQLFTAVFMYVYIKTKSIYIHTFTHFTLCNNDNYVLRKDLLCSDLRDALLKNVILRKRKITADIFG